MTWSRAWTARRRYAACGCSRRAAASPGSGIGRRTPRVPASGRGACRGAPGGPSAVAERHGHDDRERVAALVLTISDGVAAGAREDTGGAGVAGRVEAVG